MRGTSVLGAALALVLLFGAGIAPAQGADRAQAVAAEWSQAEREKGYIVFEHSTLRLLPRTYVPRREAIAAEIPCVLARGEYKSLQIGVHALTGDLKNVSLELDSDLEARIYRPIDAKVRELLLGYINPIPVGNHDACLDESNAIASIAEGETSFFWLTLHATKGAVVGRRRGRIRIEAEGRPVTELELEATVRPFELARARIAYAPFFYGHRVSWLGGQALPKFTETDAWMGAIFRDMAEHSHTSMIGLGRAIPGAAIDFSKVPPPENRTFTTLLPLTRQAGLTSPDIPVIVMFHNMTQPETQGGLSVHQKNRAMDWYETERRKHGWPELVTYGWDEPVYPNPELRDMFVPFRGVRMRVGTAQNAIAAYGLGDLHDIWIVFGGQITAEMCAEAERLGAEVWTYSFKVYPVSPLIERYYAGLYVWAHRLKGHTTWHHYAQDGYKHIWMREGDDRPMPLVGWETRREGIDDYRYLQMLEDCVAANPNKVLAAEAGNWLNALRARITTDPHKVEPGKPLALAEYDLIREKAAGYIERLGPVPPEQIPPRPVSRLKDEARPFRDKSAEECTAALASDDISVRRAAAWALSEMGAKAAPAVPALANALTDPEVRMPALRALEAIGPPVFQVAEKLAALLKHPDGFVRLGATLALGSMGSPPPDIKWLTEQNVPIVGPQPGPESRAALEPLRSALKDEFGPVVMAAGRQLVRFGTYAAPALPEAIELLAHPEWEYWLAGLRIIASMGPRAGSAVPKIVNRYEAAKGQAPYEAVALAALGSAAVEAVPVLEKYATPDSRYLADAYYALFCIRHNSADLQEMVKLLRRTDLNRPRQKHYVVMYLNALGVEAAAVADLARACLQEDAVSTSADRAGLRAYLEKVEKRQGPFVLLP